MKMKMKGNEDEVEEMRMGWKLLNQDAKRGTQRRGKEKTPNTRKPGPPRANPEKARKKKSGGRRKRKRPAEGGEGRTRLNQPTTANLRLPQHAQNPTYLERGERRNTWNKGPMGNQLMKWCIHNACRIRDKAQRPSAFKSQPSGQLTCSTPELRAQLNLTNDHQRNEMKPTNPNAHTYVNGTEVKTHGYAVTHNTFLQ